MKDNLKDKLPIHAYLSEIAHNGWHDYAEEHGVSISGLIEALGVRLFETGDMEWSGWVKEARKVDVKRRRRG